jgi:hypothetical protein
MAGFDFLFEGFTLLLGLAMAEALGGYAAMLKLRARRRVPGASDADNPQRIGLLLPLLILVVLGLLSTFWLDIYQAQNQIPFNLATVLVMLLFIGSYYVVASLLWPERPEDWADLDDYYFAHRKFVILALLGLSFVQSLLLELIGIEWPDPAPPPGLEGLAQASEATDIASLLAFLALAFLRGRRLSLLLLLVVVASLVVEAVASAMGVGMYVGVVPA